MNHADIRARMADYLDGELNLDKRALFDGHLDQCNDCSQEFQEMKTTIQLLRRLPDVEPPPTLVDDVMRRVREGEGQASLLERVLAAIGDSLIPKIALPVTAVAAAAAIVVVANDIEILGRGVPSASSSVPIASTAVPGGGGDGAIGIRAGGASDQSMGSAKSLGSPIRERLALRDGAAPGRDSDVGSMVVWFGGDPTHPMILQPRIEQFVSERPPLRGANVPPSYDSTPVRNVSIGVNGPASSRGPYAQRYEYGPLDVRSELRSGADATAADKDERRRAQLDARLASLLQDPTAFARDLETWNAAEQGLWMDALANRAVERGVADAVVRALLENPDLAAEDLGAEFANAVAKARRSGAATMASSAEFSNEGTAAPPAGGTR